MTVRAFEKDGVAHVRDVVAILVQATMPEQVVLGGGNVRLLDHLPPGCRVGENANAFIGGFRIWDAPKT